MRGAGALSPSSHGEVSWAFWLKEDEGRGSVLPEYRRRWGPSLRVVPGAGMDASW